MNFIHTVKTKLFLGAFFAVIVLGGLSSCDSPPQYSDIPHIGLNRVSFVEGGGASVDKLVVDISFQDGNGDLGLADSDTLGPYKSYTPKLDENGNVIKYGSRPGLPPLDLDETTASLRNWFLVDGDTILHHINPHGNNFHLEIYTKENNEFKLFDFVSQGKRPIAGRFPILFQKIGEPLEGDIVYTEESSSIGALFKTKILKFKIYIYDRSLNKSNVLETSEFQLSDITK
ncbi:hypothetical protein FUAX_12930 [Fulvitalea axinellae]|uniref:NigD-like protein n=1 Tax=Fulvitalea axinellae TaxID=1182444 RepID=A0AAU9D7L3_9BACT|nr:hypothetical protein FUAX_12930 [Fulvitalea axinellae]